MSKKVICIIILSFMLTACEKNKATITEKNRFFFPEGQTEIEVFCELNILHHFSGSAKLEINPLSETEEGQYYEIKLVDLKGKCDEHKKIGDGDCEYSSDFPIGYFYCTQENIYIMPYDTDYLTFFNDTNVFPPTEELIYRLVCSEQEVKDVFGTTDNVLLDKSGMICDEDYHNYITADGNERKYNLWPEKIKGTQEYMYITWKEEKGMVYYANWAGNMKNYISFWVPSYEVHRENSDMYN